MFLKDVSGNWKIAWRDHDRWSPKRAPSDAPLPLRLGGLHGCSDRCEQAVEEMFRDFQAPAFEVCQLPLPTS